MKNNFNPIIHTLFNIFKQHNFELYLVGGCVRDFIMQRSHNDYDMCTNATPNQMIQIANIHDIKVIPTGIKHGTLTFIIKHLHIEITTYRNESHYENNRYPKEVSFTTNLKDDIIRRDFTINAICMNETEIIDYFNGISDIKNKIIRCVNDPKLRFKEDALRILRCLRFSFILNFTIESQTYQALKENALLLNNISKERIRDELCKMLMSNTPNLLLKLKESNILDIIIPEYIKTYSFKQETPWHQYDLFEHFNEVMNASNLHSLNMKLALLLHDLEKVNFKTYDKNGIAHFYGHAQASAKLAKQILRRLKFDNKTIQEVSTLIDYHDYYLINDEKVLHKFMYKIKGNFKLAYNILDIQYADNKGKNLEKCIDKNKTIEEVIKTLKIMEKKKECFSIKDLNINGNDLIELGYTSKNIGLILEYLLKCILNQQNKNNKEDLIKLIGGY